MDRITTPISIQQPGMITPRAPHYKEEERKRQQSESEHRETEENKEEPGESDTPQSDRDSSVGTKIDIQI